MSAEAEKGFGYYTHVRAFNMTALQIIKAKDAPQVISLVTHPVVPLPMRVDVIDQYGKTSTLTYSYCHSKNGSVMSQLKVYEDNQPVESLSATVAGDNICLFEHVFDEKLSILKVNIPEKLEHIAFGKGKTYEKDSFEDYLNEAHNGLPTFARFDRFARIIPDTIEVDKDVVRFLFADGSCLSGTP